MLEGLKLFMVCLDGDEMPTEPLLAADPAAAADLYIQGVISRDAIIGPAYLTKAPCIWVSEFVPKGPGLLGEGASTSIPKWSVPSWKSYLNGLGQESVEQRAARLPVSDTLGGEIAAICAAIRPSLSNGSDRFNFMVLDDLGCSVEPANRTENAKVINDRLACALPAMLAQAGIVPQVGMRGYVSLCGGVTVGYYVDTSNVTSGWPLRRSVNDERALAVPLTVTGETVSQSKTSILFFGLEDLDVEVSFTGSVASGVFEGCSKMKSHQRAGAWGPDVREEDEQIIFERVRDMASKICATGWSKVLETDMADYLAEEYDTFANRDFEVDVTISNKELELDFRGSREGVAEWEINKFLAPCDLDNATIDFKMPSIPDVDQAP